MRTWWLVLAMGFLAACGGGDDDGKVSPADAQEGCAKLCDCLGPAPGQTGEECLSECVGEADTAPEGCFDCLISRDTCDELLVDCQEPC